MSFTLFDIEVIKKEGIYCMGFFLVKNWEKEYARYFLGVNYYDRSITVHLFFKEFYIDLRKGE